MMRRYGAAERRAQVSTLPTIHCLRAKSSLGLLRLGLAFATIKQPEKTGAREREAWIEEAPIRCTVGTS